jgi:hypothetical protein
MHDIESLTLEEPAEMEKSELKFRLQRPIDASCD